MDKKERAFLACDSCRRSKLRCIAEDNLSICERCSRLDLICQYTPKRSQLKKSLKIKANDYSNTIHNLNKKYRKQSHILDSIILPNKALLVEFINDFFENQYHSIFNFIHKKSYIDWIQSDTFEIEFFNYDDPNNVPVFTPCTLLAILALVSRNNSKLSKFYGTFNQSNDPIKYIPDFNNSISSPTNSSRYFAFYSRLLLKDVFDTPSVQRIQSLTLLSSHEWSEGNYSRSYLYIGIAARMSSILGLCSPRGVCYQNDSFILKESKRRTIWSVFMMDRCNSSGRNRNHAIKIEDIEISLPCPDENFQNDIETKFPNYNDCFKNFNDLTSLNLCIISYELWSKIAKWIGDIGAKNSDLNPMNPNSNFFKIYSDLELLKEKLPNELKITNLDNHLKTGNLNIGYLHQLLYICEIFLIREYFYYNSKISKNDHITFTKKLINILKLSTDLNLKLIKQKSFIFSPFTFFLIFTNCITSLSIASILNDEELIKISTVNLSILEDNLDKDQLIQLWFNISKQLKDYLNQKDLNYDKFKNLFNDFGESDIHERFSISEPKIKKIELHDLLNNDDNEENNQLTPDSINEGDLNDEFTNKLDNYFNIWEKIIPNWNDVFIEFDQEWINNTT